MDRIDFFFCCKLYDAFDIQVRLYGSFASSDLVRLIRFEMMQTEAIFLRVDGYRPQA